MAPCALLCHGSCIPICAYQFTWIVDSSHTETRACYFCMPRIQEKLIIGLLFHQLSTLIQPFSPVILKQKGKKQFLSSKNLLGGFSNQAQAWCFCHISCKRVWPSPLWINHYCLSHCTGQRKGVCSNPLVHLGRKNRGESLLSFCRITCRSFNALCLCDFPLAGLHPLIHLTNSYWPFTLYINYHL